MTLILTVVVIVLVLAVLALLVWLIVANSANAEKLASGQASIGLLQQQLEAIKSAADSTKDTLAKSLQAGQSNISQNLQAGQKVLGQLNAQVGELQGTNKQMLQLGADVKRLQDILSSPKLRGQMGEWSLENLLINILPADSYELQHTFKDGKIVDALVKLNEFSVPIDAKFPLPGFERMLNAETEETRAKLRKAFHKDIAVHIDKIATSYIRPVEGTLDFALMFIPAENIYYETVVKYTSDTRDILQEALDKKVIPVSPNLLYAYLMTVVMGLHGLKIEEQAEQICRNLKKLNADFAEFLSSWDTLGGHIRKTSNKYDETNKNLDRFSIQLEQMQGEEES